MTKYIITALLFVVIFGAYFYFVNQNYPDMPTRGQFGDMFGGLNAAFSGLAFLGVIYAILLQREELGLQRKELELTRKELKRTAEAQEKSQEALSKQAESLKATAKLNGLSALLQRYTSIRNEALSRGSSGTALTWDQKSKSVTDQIEQIIELK